MSATPLKIHDNERDAAEESFPDQLQTFMCNLGMPVYTTTTLYKIHIPRHLLLLFTNQRREKRKKHVRGIACGFRESIDGQHFSSKPADGAKRIK